ncbi:UDP-N-acetylmuramate--alanine ligase, partial [bacterium]|nr:UDP-N-acetylmuramate--alanine ligase [bacterium]MBU1675899.1 UDP-N-acetylmuramate--alanine ligase [bacterium]
MSSCRDRTSSGSAPSCFFAGVGGSGMSALAQYHAWRGGQARGSDRAFDRGERSAVRAALV